MTRCFFGILLLIAVCISYNRQKYISKNDLIAYISDKKNGLIRLEDINDIQMQLTFHPSSLLVAQELGSRLKDTASIKKLEAKYSSHYYFILKISKNKKEVIRQLGSFDRYSDMLQILAFKLPEYINLTAAPKDTLPLADYYFDQTYGMSDGNSMMLSFNRAKLAALKDININIGECGLGIGNQTFSFKIKDLEKVPELDYLQ